MFVSQRDLHSKQNAVSIFNTKGMVFRYDGENGFYCFERKCKKNRSIVRCEGEQGHGYPDIPAQEFAWEFMKNHPRQN